MSTKVWKHILPLLDSCICQGKSSTNSTTWQWFIIWRNSQCSQRRVVSIFITT